jgi:hypothetical protein
VTKDEGPGTNANGRDAGAQTVVFRVKAGCRQKMITFDDIVFIHVMVEAGTAKACGDDRHCRVNPHFPHIGTFGGATEQEPPRFHAASYLHSYIATDFTG